MEKLENGLEKGLRLVKAKVTMGQMGWVIWE